MGSGSGGAGTVTPWNVLANAITKKVDESKAKRQKAKDQEEQVEFQIRMGAINDALSRPDDPKSAAIIDQAVEQMKKAVPKDSVPIIDAYHKVVSMVHQKKSGSAAKKGQPGQPGQPGQSGQPQPGGQPGTPQPQPPAQNAQPGAPASATAPGTGEGGPQVPPNMSLGQMATMARPSAAQTALAESEATLAQDKVAYQSRNNTLNSLRNSYKEKGKELPKDLEEALTVWTATGTMPQVKHKMTAVSVLSPDGQGLIPGMEDEEGNVWSGGQIVPNAKVMPKWKPRKAVMRDAQGKFFSVSVDPQTNQPVPGTENYQELPPSSYLDKIRTREQAIFDDAGNMSVASLSTTTHTNVPGNVSGKGSTPAVPPAMRDLPAPRTGKGNGKGTGTSSGAGKVRPTDYTKDVGLLSPAGQKVLMTTEPVLNQANKLEKIFEDHPELKDNDTPGYLLLPYIAYRLGYAEDGALESEIAGLSLGSVIEAASVLQGTSRSISALRLAMVHTPNAKVDSPQQIYRKLHNDIIPRLDDVMSAAKKYGRKRSTASDTTVPPDITQPGPNRNKTIDQQADEILAK